MFKDEKQKVFDEASRIKGENMKGGKYAKVEVVVSDIDNSHPFASVKLNQCDDNTVAVALWCLMECARTVVADNPRAGKILEYIMENEKSMGIVKNTREVVETAEEHENRKKKGV